MIERWNLQIKVLYKTNISLLHKRNGRVLLNFLYLFQAGLNPTRENFWDFN